MNGLFDQDTLTSRPYGTADEPGTFLCVCGASVALPAGDETVSCPACRRKYTPSALRRYGADTRTEQMPDPAQDARKADDAQSGLPSVLPKGTRLGHFEVQSVIGRGGMGMVYKALDVSLQRFVALKVLRPSLARDRSHRHVEKLFQEARSQARINHPNVAHIYYVGIEGGVPYLAMELVHGPTLSKQIQAGPLPFNRIIHCALQVTQALEFAARYDIVHGDIKPSNMLLAPGDVVKLSDFGQARRISERPGSPVVVAGTPNYIPPESEEENVLRIQSDMYMLGVSFFELTFGRLPYSFPSLDFADKLRVHQTAPVEWPDPWPNLLPMRWKKVLERLLAKNPDDRFADYPELLSELRELQPLGLPRSGRIARGVAWGIDLAIAFGLQLLCALSLFSLDRHIDPSEVSLPSWLFMAAVSLPPAFMSLLQALWGTSPGKHFFHLRIVDRHGLPLGPIRLALRMMLQMLPVWFFAATEILKELELSAWIKPTQIGVGTFLLLEMLVTFFHPRTRGLHDIFFKTRVVYDFRDARPEE